MRAITARFKDRVPLLANMVEGGATPMFDVQTLTDIGYRMVIFPGGLVRARARMEYDYFTSLKTHGWNQPFRDKMLGLQELNDVLGTDEILAAGARFDAENFKD